MNKKVAEKTEFEKHKESLTENQSEGSSELDKAFVSSDQKVLDPTLLCLLYTSPSPRDGLLSRMPSSA